MRGPRVCLIGLVGMRWVLGVWGCLLRSVAMVSAVRWQLTEGSRAPNIRPSIPRVLLLTLYPSALSAAHHQ